MRVMSDTSSQKRRNSKSVHIFPLRIGGIESLGRPFLILFGTMRMAGGRPRANSFRYIASIPRSIGVPHFAFRLHQDSLGNSRASHWPRRLSKRQRHRFSDAEIFFCGLGGKLGKLVKLRP
jgi:hypothetical protein